MARTLLDAIKQGIWNFEPTAEQPVETAPTRALPGTPEKVDILAERLRQGAPLWHPSDRLSFEEESEE